MDPGTGLWFSPGTPIFPTNKTVTTTKVKHNQTDAFYDILHQITLNCKIIIDISVHTVEMRSAETLSKHCCLL
jgi:hypothetical protein